jgi:hypothetical protein
MHYSVKLLQMFPEVIKYPLTTALEDIKTLCQRIRGCWQPYDKYVLFAQVANTLLSHRVANTLALPITHLAQGCQYPLTPCNKFARGLSTISDAFARGLPWAGIHKACLCKKTDLKTDSFQTLFINACLVVYPTFYRTDLSTNISALYQFGKVNFLNIAA